MIGQSSFARSMVCLRKSKALAWSSASIVCVYTETVCHSAALGDTACVAFWRRKAAEPSLFAMTIAPEVLFISGSGIVLASSPSL